MRFVTKYKVDNTDFFIHVHLSVAGVEKAAMCQADCVIQDTAADCILCWQGRETPRGMSMGPAKLTAAGQAPSWTPSWDLLLPVQVEESLLFQLSSGREET